MNCHDTEIQDVGKVYAEAVSGDVPSGQMRLSFWCCYHDLYRCSASMAGAIGYSRRVQQGLCRYRGMELSGADCVVEIGTCPCHG